MARSNQEPLNHPPPRRRCHPSAAAWCIHHSPSRIKAGVGGAAATTMPPFAGRRPCSRPRRVTEHLLLPPPLRRRYGGWRPCIQVRSHPPPTLFSPFLKRRDTTHPQHTNPPLPPQHPKNSPLPLRRAQAPAAPPPRVPHTSRSSSSSNTPTTQPIGIGRGGIGPAPHRCGGGGGRPAAAARDGGTGGREPPAVFASAPVSLGGGLIVEGRWTEGWLYICVSGLKDDRFSPRKIKDDDLNDKHGEWIHAWFILLFECSCCCCCYVRNSYTLGRYRSIIN
jgi:hypothetical protein